MDYEEFLKNLQGDDEDFLKQVYKRYKKYNEEQILRPYQAELIKLQNHLEKTQQKMVFLSRDVTHRVRVVVFDELPVI